MRAFCAFPLLFEGTDKLLILHIGIICTSIHSIISLRTCHLSHTPFSLESFPHNMFPFHSEITDVFFEEVCCLLGFLRKSELLDKFQPSLTNFTQLWKRCFKTLHSYKGHETTQLGKKRDLINTSVQQRLLLELNLLGIGASNQKLFLIIQHKNRQHWFCCSKYYLLLSFLPFLRVNPYHLMISYSSCL